MLITGFIGSSIFMFSNAFSPNVLMFIATKLIYGVFYTMTYLGGMVYVLEISPCDWRTYASFGYEINDVVGQMTLAMISYFVRDWKYLTIVCSLLFIPFAVLTFFIDESPQLRLDGISLEILKSLNLTKP